MNDWMARVRQRSYYWSQEIRRLWMPLLAILGMWVWGRELDPTTPMARTLTKINLLTTGAVLFHIIRRQMFPYLNVGTWLDWLKTTAEKLLKSNDPIKVLGACFLIGCAWIGACLLLGLLASAIIQAFTRGI